MIYDFCEYCDNRTEDSCSVERCSFKMQGDHRYRTSSPCRVCLHRSAECRISCTPYHNWDADDKAKREEMNRARKTQHEFDGIRIDGAAESSKIKRHMKGKNG